MKHRIILVVAVAAGVLAVAAVGGYALYRTWWHTTYYEVDISRYDPPPDNDELPLANDAPGQQKLPFDATLVDSRPLGDRQLNASAAVIRLDCPMIKPDVEGAMLVLRPSFTEAIKAARQAGLDLLPSANMLDASAKQFDDGMYAALDMACFRGDLAPLPAAPAWVAAVWQRLPAGSTARPFLAAALELAGRPVQPSGYQRHDVDQWLASFDKDKTASKPIGFYDWTPELTQVWRFCRFLQHEFKDGELAAPRDIAAVLKGQPELRRQYVAINGFYGRLTNPLACLSIDALVDTKSSLRELARRHGAWHGAVAVFPPSISRETELFERMFAFGLPTNLGGHARVNMMAALIQRIRSGRVDLKPRPNDGWYQYQVYALETLLLPTAGPEKDKLLLTAEYKKRLMEAFEAIVTKQRETHVRQLAVAKSAAEPPGEQAIAPRLRVEPCPTFYLRTARAYAFIRNFLHGAVGPERLGKLHGLRSNGQRDQSLGDELDAFARRFYGFYLVSCEDIGMRAKFLDDEPVDRPAARQAALKWLEKPETDRDLACDTRVAVPIYIDPPRQTTRLWADFGVRLAHLEATYTVPPSVRPRAGGGDWKEVSPFELGACRRVIAVDEFAEFELPALNVLSRQELREACDRYQTKEEVIRRLAQPEKP
jgi:hypothetical protein